MGLGSIFSFGKKEPIPAIKVQYFPDTGIIIDGNAINWGMERTTVRAILDHKHVDDDHSIDNSSFFDGDNSYNIEIRRDIYQNIKGIENYFFFLYDAEHKLTEIEIHSGAEIHINTGIITFNEKISKFVKQLHSLGYKYFEIEEGKFYFPALKILIASDESMGGDTPDMAYFYCGKDVSHLDEDIKT